MPKIMRFARVMLKNLVSPPVTKNYPAEPIVYPEGSRGHVEVDIDKCISCNLCALNCPAGAIKVSKKDYTWTINRFDCVQCGYCTQKCPKKCLTIVPGYQVPDAQKKEAVYKKSDEAIAAEEAKKAEAARKAAEAKRLAEEKKKAAEAAAAAKAAEEAKIAE